MMAPRRVVIVHEAERLLSPRREGRRGRGAAGAGGRKRQARASTPAEELEAYIEQPEPMTTLVFVAGRSTRTAAW